jgi:hypothetical protein
MRGEHPGGNTNHMQETLGGYGRSPLCSQSSRLLTIRDVPYLVDSKEHTQAPVKCGLTGEPCVKLWEMFKCCSAVCLFGFTCPFLPPALLAFQVCDFGLSHALPMDRSVVSGVRHGE